MGMTRHSRFPKGGHWFPQATLLESGVKPPHSKVSVNRSPSGG